jgi:hypothetical protein
VKRKRGEDKKGHLRHSALSLTMAKKGRGEDGQNEALLPLSRVLRSLARGGVVEAFLLSTANEPVLRIRRGLRPLDARRLRRSAKCP